MTCNNERHSGSDGGAGRGNFMVHGIELERRQCAVRPETGVVLSEDGEDGDSR